MTALPHYLDTMHRENRLSRERLAHIFLLFEVKLVNLPKIALIYQLFFVPLHPKYGQKPVYDLRM
jgi:hypothetical protein